MTGKEAGPASARRRDSGPLDVYLSVDVEVWCDGWQDIDAKFAQAFRQYIHGPTSRGEFGLPYQLRVLREHGLAASFFVEPLFSARFGTQPLAEIVGLLTAAEQDVQLHLHTEWVDEARQPLLADGVRSKRQHLRHFGLEQQTALIAEGQRRLIAAGATPPTAFRAGSFGFDANTLPALERCGIAMDSSYNLTMLGPSSGLSPDVPLTDTAVFGAVCELPMTVFRDGAGRMRHAQLTACSWAEMKALLEQAQQTGQRAFMILSHGSELLDRSRTRPDRVVVDRFRRLCAFLARHRDRFRLRRFDQGWPRVGGGQPPPLSTPIWPTALRLAEQAYRRRPSWILG